MSKMKMVNIKQVPRIENIRVDALTKLALLLQGKILRMILVKLLSSKSVDQKNPSTILTLKPIREPK